MLTLHGYWRSGTSYRARIALNLKGAEYTQVSHDLRRGEQSAPAYLALQPQGLVPALETATGSVLIQSPAILEWLEEVYPEPALLPTGREDRATVRSMAAIIGCDVHPLNNLRVLDRLRGTFGADGGAVKEWIAHWIGAGFGALEQLVAQHGGTLAFGDSPTLADVYLVPQVYAAERFGVDLAPYPRIVAAVQHARNIPAIAAADPARQPDADQ